MKYIIHNNCKIKTYLHYIRKKNGYPPERGNIAELNAIYIGLLT